MPAGLQTGAALLLPVPAVGRGWPVAGAVALLVRLLAPRLVRRPALPHGRGAWPRSSPWPRECLPPRGAVLDATVWQVVDGALERGPSVRNLLLAGRDPVAVDAVACRLAGRRSLAGALVAPVPRPGLSASAGPSGIRLAGQHGTGRP